MTDSVKTVAWLWPNPDGTHEYTVIDPRSDMAFSTALAMCLGREAHELVKRSDYEAAKARVERLEDVLRELARQIEIGTFVDQHGHKATMLKAYHDARTALADQATGSER